MEAHTTSFNAVTQHVLIQDVDEPEAIADVRGTCPVCHVRAARAHPRSIDPNRVMIIRINHGKALTTMTEVGMAQTLQTEYGWHRVNAAACHPGNTPHAGITSHCSRVGMVTGRSPTTVTSARSARYRALSGLSIVALSWTARVYRQPLWMDSVQLRRSYQHPRSE